MAKLPLCTACHQPIEDTPVTYRSKKYHTACLERMKQAARAKDAAVAAKSSDPDLQALTVYLCQKFEQQTLSPLLRKQVRDYKEDGLSYADMLLALRYFFDETEHQPVGQSIGIIPYVIEDAKTFQKLVQEADKHNKIVSNFGGEAHIHINPRRWDDAPKYRIEDL